MRSIFNLRVPSDVRAGEPVRANDHNLILSVLRKLISEVRKGTLQNSSDISISRDLNGTRAKLKRRLVGGSSVTTTCDFGEIMTWKVGEDTKTGIRGGILKCGKHNWVIPPQELNLSVAGKWKISIKVEVEVNRDDDHELVMPGIKTGTKPEGDWEKTVATEPDTDYPDNVPPTPADGKGTIYVPIGTLEIADEAATIAAEGCGRIVLTHCGDDLDYYRGDSAIASGEEEEA